MQPANWAVRNSRVSYAYILVGKLSVLPRPNRGDELQQCCVYDCTNRVKNGSVGTKARFSEYLCFGSGSRDATISQLHSLPFSNTFFICPPREAWLVTLPSATRAQLLLLEPCTCIHREARRSFLAQAGVLNTATPLNTIHFGSIHSLQT